VWLVKKVRRRGGPWHPDEYLAYHNELLIFGRSLDSFNDVVLTVEDVSVKNLLLQRIASLGEGHIALYYLLRRSAPGFFPPTWVEDNDSFLWFWNQYYGKLLQLDDRMLKHRAEIIKQVVAAQILLQTTQTHV
jgi:hypothetical protein